jgi:uncharacterized DUF497 family protein
MRFEFDPVKSAATKQDRGIDFVEAQAIWDDPDRLERPARSTTEPRVQVLGRIQQTIWSAIVTYRHEGHEKGIRIISVRRAHENEEALYRGEERQR